MQVQIKDVIIKRRIRINLGNLNQLSESLRAHGLMNPVLITAKNELIAGHRRLEAAKLLGWKTIEAKVVPNISEADKLEMEIDENLHRRPLSPDELADGYSRLTRMRNPGFFRRIWNVVTAFFRKIFKKKRR